MFFWELSKLEPYPLYTSVASDGFGYFMILRLFSGDIWSRFMLPWASAPVVDCKILLGALEFDW